MMKRLRKTALFLLILSCLIFAIADISQANYEGTIGTRFIINGSGFGTKKPAVYLEYEKSRDAVGKVNAKVISWSDISVTCLWTSKMLPGVYKLFVKPNIRRANPISIDTFTVMNPIVEGVFPNTASSDATITINGRFFSSKRPTIYLEDPTTYKRQVCKVLHSQMNPDTGESSLQFVAPKIALGNHSQYHLILKNIIGETSYAIAPYLLPVSQLISPLNDATGVSMTPTLSWTSVSGASSYRIMAATSAAYLPSDPTSDTCSYCVINDTTGNVYYTPTVALNPGTTYYWQVNGRNATQCGAWSSQWSFTTQAYANNFEAKGTTLVNLSTGDTVFLKGIGYSPFLPGETPVWGANLPNDNRYKGHLDAIKKLNVNFLHVFPQFMPEHFYAALTQTDLMYAQDIYVNGYTKDLLDEAFQQSTIEFIRKVIDHTFSVGRPDRLVFFSVGDEINAGTIYNTDTAHPSEVNFDGNYIHLSNRTPSEIAIAKLMDAAITYEYGSYGVRHLYCHTSWTHIGPVKDRPDLEVSQSSVFFPDFGDIICMNIYTYARGVVTSPPGSVTGTTYQGYLEDLIKISQKPIIITQVGLSTSPNAPNPNIPGFGGNSYDKVQSSYSQIWQDLKTATGTSKINGFAWFEFMDEWWKSGEEIKDESSHNINDPEEWFGIYGVASDSHNLFPKGGIPDAISVIFSP